MSSLLFMVVLLLCMFSSAKYIVKTCKQLDELGGEAWLMELRTKPLSEVQTALQQFSGIGPKVADCIALFSLDQHNAIPVDTHVWQVNGTCRAVFADG